MQVLSPFLECSIAITAKSDGPITTSAQIEALLQRPVVLPSHEHSIHSYLGTSKTVPDEISGDILITREKGLVLAHQFADCVPVLLVDRKKKGIVFAHAGWKGAVSGIIPISLLHAQHENGSDKGDLWVWIGPSIHKQSYVLPMPPAQVVIPGWEDFIAETREGYQVDLPGFIRSQCLEFGIDDTRIIIDGRDTYLEADLFSHRKYLETQDVRENGNFAVGAWLTQ
ncbi:MAG TPA: laccase domain-containing protein [Patescibacteria group bacterium]|nr:laccase domain-containing protein [Patescibacteria group bacterium]